MSFIQWDKDLLVSLNSHHSDFWDGFMWMATDEMSWLVFFAMLLYAIYKYKGKEFFLVIMAIALTVLICDQVSGLVKDLVARPRPSREPDIITGMSFGTFAGYGVYKLHRSISKRFVFISYTEDRSIPLAGVVLSFLATLFMMMVGSEAINDFLL